MIQSGELMGDIYSGGQHLTLLEIVNILDGTLSPVECLDNPSVCSRSARCATRIAWERMKQAKEDVLRSITIKELLEHEKENFIPDYSI